MKIKLVISLVFICLLFGGCKKDLPSLNINPNDSLVADPELIFKHSLRRGMSNYLTSSNLEYNGISSWVMYFANRNGINPNVPYISPPGGDSFWNETYIDAMNNAQVVIDFEDPEIANLKAAARVWKVYQAHRITDLWGSIPYSDALKGYSELNLAPAYDTQKEVYEQFFADLELAVESFDESASSINAESDLLFNGDTQLWKKFANSLRFRLAMRVSTKDQAMAQEILDKLSISDLFESNELSAKFQFNSVFNNPLNEAGNIRYFEGEQYINPSKFLVDKLVSTEDPRLKFMIEEANLYDTFDFLDPYKGVPNLLAFNSDDWSNYNLDATLGDPLGEWGDVSRLGEFYLNNDRPLPILSYSELCFLMAEAAERGMWPGNSLSFLQEGITSHMQYMNQYNYSNQEDISESEIQNYLSSITKPTLEEIGTQKWLLFAYENVLEAFAEFRRTGYPKFTDFYGELINVDQFPKRLVYPNSEFTLNRDNYIEAIELQGSDNINTPLWWAN